MGRWGSTSGQRMRLLSVLAVVALMQGCARLVPSVNYTAAGAADAELDRANDERMREAIKNGAPGSEEVVVLVDAAPEGIRMEAGRPVVDPAFQHQVLGKMSIEARTGGFLFIARFLDYRETWRKALCYWQVPLEWFTLGLWSIVPLSYGCFAGAAVLGKEDALSDAKNAAMAVGADLVLLTYARERNEKVKGVTGWLLKLGPRTASATPTPPPLPAMTETGAREGGGALPRLPK